MRTFYTNISPISKAYTNINYLFSLKNHNPQKVFLCVWDSFVFEHPAFEKESNQEKTEKLKENVEFLEKLMHHLKIDYKIIYLSEAMSRLFRNSAYLKEFQSILSTLRLEKLQIGEDIGYVPFKMMSLSKINYSIADYLIASYLPELFPELCSTAPNFYLTSGRFKIFSGTVNHCLKSDSFKNSFPKPVYVSNIPVIIHPEKEIIPSMGMSFESINSIVLSHYPKIPEEKELDGIIEVLSSVLKKFVYKEKEYSSEKISRMTKTASYKDCIEFISVNLYKYFNELSKFTAEIRFKKQKTSSLVSTYAEFNNYLKSLNEIKIQILKHCDGKNTSLDISKLTGQKLSTVSTYLTKLKSNGLLTNARKPERVFDSLIIDLSEVTE